MFVLCAFFVCMYQKNLGSICKKHIFSQNRFLFVGLNEKLFSDHMIL